VTSNPNTADSRPGKNAFGDTVIDPTENVIALSDASNRRQDDLRVAEAERQRDIRHFQDKLLDEKIRRMEEQAIHQDRIAILRADHNKEIRHMESDRVDKIRSVDVANAAATATQLLSAVTTLATTAQATAETLRNQVAATAAAVASQTERVVNPILERVALLEKSSYTGAGKAGVADPQLAELSAAVNKLLSAGSLSTGKSEGFSTSWAILLGAVALLGGLLTIGSMIFVFSNRNAPVPPQVIYATPPTATPVR
jgi:hypothetical protein